MMCYHIKLYKADRLGNILPNKIKFIYIYIYMILAMWKQSILIV